VNLQALSETKAATQAWADLEDVMAKFWPAAGFAEDQWKRTGSRMRFWKGAQCEIGGAIFESPTVNEQVQPLVLTQKFPTFTIPIGVSCSRLHILGHVTLPSGYPVIGKAGEASATYTVHFSGGGSQQIPLRNGIEIARANLIHAATRVNPIASAAPRALVFTKDVVRERYQVLLYSLPVNGRKVASLEVKLSPGAEPLLIFAVTAEREGSGGRA